VRVGTQLVGLRADTERTLEQLRLLFSGRLVDEHVPWAFDVRLDGACGPGRGPVEVPQLRVGSCLVARSRTADDVLTALAAVLGGVRRQQEAPGGARWRLLVRDGRAVLLDARGTALVADPVLTRAGVVEPPVWIVDPDDDGTVTVPPPLDGLDWPAVGIATPEADARTFAPAGLVAVTTGDDGDVTPLSPADLLAAIAARHATAAWFRTVEQLLRTGRVAVVADRDAARDRIVDLLDRP
jgi:hypothetical protein